MESQTITATRREELGTKATRRLRKRGQLPAIVYGRGSEPAPIALPTHEIEIAVQHGGHLLQLDLDGTEQQYLIKEVQFDYLGTTPIHLDLVQVDVHEVVEVSVPIELRGTPAGISDGGALDQVMNDLGVRCRVTEIPESIRPNVASLQLGETLYVRDIKLPDGVETAVDEAEAVAVVRALAVEEEVVAEAEVAEGQAEPEIIGKDKKEEEEGEGKA